ncbi:MAG: sulfotransferase family 2 domain-containing protein [Candidatus Latescibacterota bacterium]
MPVYHRHKLIHIHIPKTAGTAIEQFFHDIGDMEWGPLSWVGQERRGRRWFEFQHLTYQELKSFTASEYDAFTSFAVVRNPYLRCVSDYLWHRAPPRRTFDSLDAFLDSIPRDLETSWEDHIWGADQQTANVLIHTRPQHHYIFDPSGNCLVHHILRFESLEADMTRFLAPYGLSASFIKPRSARPIEQYLERAQLDLINEIYAVDFDRLSYPVQ